MGRLHKPAVICYKPNWKSGLVSGSVSRILTASEQHMAEFNQPGGRKKIRLPTHRLIPDFQEGAAGLLLVAAANETGWLECFEQATATCAAASLLVRPAANCCSPYGC